MSTIVKSKPEVGIEMLSELPITTTNKMQTYKLREDLIAKYSLRGRRG